MARSSEPAGRRLRAGGHRVRPVVVRHRSHLLVGLAVADLTLATGAMLALGSRSLGPIIAVAVLGLAAAERIEAL